MKFEKYKASVFSNVSHDTVTHFTMAITTVNAANDIFDHYQIFIEKIREHYVALKQPFEFRVPPGDTAFRDLIQKHANPSHWNHSQAGGMDVWALK